MDQANRWWIPLRAAGIVALPWERTGQESQREEATNSLARLAALWRSLGHPRGLLLHGEGLADVETWAATHADALSEDEQDFLTECRDAERHATLSQRMHDVVCCIAVLGFIMAALTWHTGAQSRQENRQATKALQEIESTVVTERALRATAQCQLGELDEDLDRLQLAEQRTRAMLAATWRDMAAVRSQALAAQAHLAAEEDGDLGTLLALEALYASHQSLPSCKTQAEAGTAIYHALGHGNWEIAPSDLDRVDATGAYISPHGQALFATDEMASIHDVATGKRLGGFRLDHGPLVSAFWSTQGDLVALVDQTQDAVLVDAINGTRRCDLAHSVGLAQLRWSHDDSQVVGVDHADQVVAWDSRDGSVQWRWTPDSGAVVPPIEWDDPARIGVMLDGAGMMVLNAETGQVIDQIATCYAAEQPARIGLAKVLPDANGEPLLYLLPGNALVQVACSQLERNLTPAEWSRYMGSDTPYRCTCDNLPPRIGRTETGPKRLEADQDALVSPMAMIWPISSARSPSPSPGFDRWQSNSSNRRHLSTL